MKKIALAFFIGGLFGSVATKQYVKKKYQKIVDEEIKSVKEAFSRNKKTTKESIKEVTKETKAEIKEPDFQPVVAGTDYTTYYDETKKEKEAKPMDKEIYVIEPDEFDEMDGYEAEELTYYADEYLVDEDGVLIDDIESTVSYDALTHFGDYEPDSVYVRNDTLKKDYLILLDERNFKEVRNQMSVGN